MHNPLTPLIVLLLMLGWYLIGLITIVIGNIIDWLLDGRQSDFTMAHAFREHKFAPYGPVLSFIIIIVYILEFGDRIRIKLTPGFHKCKDKLTSTVIFKQKSK